MQQMFIKNKTWLTTKHPKTEIKKVVSWQLAVVGTKS